MSVIFREWNGFKWYNLQDGASFEAIPKERKPAAYIQLLSFLADQEKQSNFIKIALEENSKFTNRPSFAANERE